MTVSPFVIERTYNAPADKVWQAITDPAKMKSWYFDLPGFKPEVGYEFEFYGGEEGGEQYQHLCKVTEVIPGKKLTYSWRYPKYPGNSFVTWELFPEGGKTRLQLTHAGLDTFPQDSKNFRRESFAEGWTHIIGTGLKDFLEK